MKVRKLWSTIESAPSETIALLLTLGLVLGTFPIYGIPTVLCAAAALTFRLNVPALQAVNQLSSPLQLLLLAPLTHVGSSLFGAPAGPSIAHRLGAAMLHAAAGWCCICVPLGVACYFILLYILRRRRRWSEIVECPN